MPVGAKLEKLAVLPGSVTPAPSKAARLARAPECPYCGYRAPGPVVYRFHVDNIACAPDKPLSREAQIKALIKEQEHDARTDFRVTQRALSMDNSKEYRSRTGHPFQRSIYDYQPAEVILADLWEEIDALTAKDFAQKVDWELR